MGNTYAIMKRSWQTVCEMNRRREVTAGSLTALADAIRRGADVRTFTTFDWIDHMGTLSPDQGLVEETMDWRIVYLIDNRWVACAMCLRYPANAGLGFGKDPAPCFFMYHQNFEIDFVRPLFG